MKLPSTKDETDKILFELLEGNLTKSEEEFWYEYALKNEDFASQLALFQRIYLKEDLLSYPDHSHLLRKTTLFAKLKWPVIVSSSLVFLGLIAFYITNQKELTIEIQPRTKPITNEAKQEKQQMSIPEKAEKELNTKPTISEKQTEKMVEEPKTETKVLIEEVKLPAEIKTQMVVSDSVEKTIAPANLQGFQNLEGLNTELKKEPIVVEKQEIEQSKTPKNNKSTLPKFKIKPSRKTKTTDFNY